MAGKQSREVRFDNIEKIMKQSGNLKDVVEFMRTNEFRFNLMDVTDLQIETIISIYQEFKDKEGPILKITADMSDAIKGLKAIQREARGATAALKELEEQKNKIKH